MTKKVSPQTRINDLRAILRKIVAEANRSGKSLSREFNHPAFLEVDRRTIESAERILKADRERA